MAHPIALIPILLMPGILAQEPAGSWEDAASRFSREIRNRDVEVRVRAVGELAARGDMRALELLLPLLERTRREELALEARIQALSRRLLARQARKDDFYARARLEGMGREERRLLRALVQGLGLLFRRLSGEAEKEAALELLARRARGEGAPGLRAAFLEALGEIPHPGSLRALVTLAERDASPEIRMAALQALRGHADGRFRSLVISAISGRLRDEAWEIRAGAASLLRGLKERSAVPALIEMLEREAGRLREDAWEALRAVSGQELGPVAAVWRDWWEREGGKPQAPPVAIPAPPRTGTSFYGIETLSHRILFIVDKSGSMAEPASGAPAAPGAGPPGSKLDVAREEIGRAIAPLPGEAAFNIVFFDSDVTVWRREMMSATAEGKEAARAFLARRNAVGGTNISEALERAFAVAGRGSHDSAYGIAADTFFFLTDGRPSAGRVVEPARILDEVRRVNALRRIKIHCVGVGDHDEEFLRELARENGGQYVAR